MSGRSDAAAASIARRTRVYRAHKPIFDSNIEEIQISTSAARRTRFCFLLRWLSIEKRWCVELSVARNSLTWNQWDTGHDESVEVNQRALIDKVLARYSGEFTGTWLHPHSF